MRSGQNVTRNGHGKREIAVGPMPDRTALNRTLLKQYVDDVFNGMNRCDMAIGNGRGDENKERIRREWDLQPVLHTRLLNGQTIECCCELSVTTTYYRFDATHRISGKRDVLFAHAQGCARKLMGIAPAIAPIPLFNPLQAAPVAQGARGGGGDGDGTRMHPFNRELYEAIHLLLMCWGRPPASGGPLVEILDEIRRAPDVALPPWKAKSVNSIIEKGQRTLTAMLHALPPQNPPMRGFDFPLMHRALEAHRGRPTIWL